jgi:hypothetical protein
MTASQHPVAKTPSARGGAPAAPLVAVLRRRPHRLAAVNDNARPRWRRVLIAMAALALFAAGFSFIH